MRSCNFACSYCPTPELARQTGEIHMTPDTARAAVDLWARHLADDPSSEGEYCAILYGGEPLLYQLALTAAIAHIQ